MATLSAEDAEKLVKLGQLKTAIDQTKLYIVNSEGKVKVTNTHFTIPSGQTYATVKDALDQLVTEQSNASIEIQEITGQTTDTYAKKYKFWTGEIDDTQTGDDRYTKATHIGDIDIPKDMVVSGGTVVELTETEAQTKTGDPSAKAGKYIELTIANKTADKLYIYVADLVDIYKGYTSDSIKTEVVSLTEAEGGGQALKATAVISDKAGNLLSVLAKHESSDPDDPAYSAGLYVSGGEDIAAIKTAVESLPLSKTAGTVEYATDSEVEALFAD